MRGDRGSSFRGLRWSFWRVVEAGKFGLDWFGFTSAVLIGQGRYCGQWYGPRQYARDVVQAFLPGSDNRM